MLCQVIEAGQSCNREAKIKHHIRYFPEETIAVCKKHHRRIHYADIQELKEKYLKYTPGDAQIFYSQQDRLEQALRRIFKRH